MQAQMQAQMKVPLLIPWMRASAAQARKGIDRFVGDPKVINLHGTRERERERDCSGVEASYQMKKEVKQLC